MIHKVKNPFYCRYGQFAASGYEGQVLVVGIAVAALTGETYRMTIGKKPQVYEAPVSEIKMTGQIWISPKRKHVLITPVDLFTKKT